MMRPFKLFLYSILAPVSCLAVVGLCFAVGSGDWGGSLVVITVVAGFVFTHSKVVLSVELHQDTIIFETIFGMVEMELARVEVGLGSAPINILNIDVRDYRDGRVYTFAEGVFKVVWVGRGIRGVNDMGELLDAVIESQAK